MSHDRDQDVADQFRELGLIGSDCAESPGPAEGKPVSKKPARKQKAKPNPTKAAKRAKPAKDEELISATLVDETKQAKPAAKATAKTATIRTSAPAVEGKNQPPIRELLLLRAANVLHCGVVGDLAIVGVLGKDGTRSIRMRFDFSHKRDTRFEIRILPVAERGPGWVSSFHDRQSALAIHLYDLKAESGEIVHLAA